MKLCNLKELKSQDLKVCPYEKNKGAQIYIHTYIYLFIDLFIVCVCI